MPDRRTFVKTAGAALTASLFTGNIKGANDRVSLAIIGLGAMGSGNLEYSMEHPQVVISALCDVYPPRIEKAMAAAQKKGHQPKAVHDFREILADRSIDAVCIATPDHWHAYITVEACKAGKDVWVEKPVSVTIGEGQAMVAAARKYNRVVQAGLMQRSGDVFQKAAELVRAGAIGKVTFAETWIASPNHDTTGFGVPADGEPPAGLDWDLWQGPAPAHRFNQNRFVHFRQFWDYAGGTMTDWGVHWLDIVQMVFHEATPRAVVALGANLFFRDNRETPDSQTALFEYPDFLASFTVRECNEGGKPSNGILFRGTEGTMFVDRSVCRITPEPGSSTAPFEFRKVNHANIDHWANFLKCLRTRERPVCDIEIGYQSSATAMLGNIAMRCKTRLDWDGQRIAQQEAQRFLTRPYRAPWKLEV